MSLYRKYRPQHFKDLKGQDHIVEVLQAALKKDRVAHAYLFTGPRGTGKTSTARILARAINCEQTPVKAPCNACDPCESALQEQLTDLVEIDAASHGLVDDARSLVEKAKFMPIQAKRKIYVIDEVHMLSKSAFNALLKIIEEPPEHVHFILATTEAHKVLETIKSRCQRFDFHLASEEMISLALRDVCKAEGVSPSDEGIALLSVHARGSFRDALSLLEQVIDRGDFTEEHVQHILGLSDAEVVLKFLTSLQQGDRPQALQLLQHVYQDGANMYQFCESILAHMRKKVVADEENVPFEWIEHFFKALDQLRDPVLPLLPLELAVHKCLEQEKVSVPPEEPKPTQVLQEAPTVEREQKTRPLKKVPQKKTAQQKESVQKKDEKTLTPKQSTKDFDKDAYLKALQQSSLRTLLRYSELEYEQDGLTIAVRSQFELDKLKSQDNVKYLLETLSEVMGQKTMIHFRLQDEEPEPVGVSSSDLESVF